MDRDSISRREFLATAGIATATGLGASGFLAEQSRGADEKGNTDKGNRGQPNSGGSGKQVALVCDPADAVAATPPAQWGWRNCATCSRPKASASNSMRTSAKRSPTNFALWRPAQNRRHSAN